MHSEDTSPDAALLDEIERLAQKVQPSGPWVADGDRYAVHKDDRFIPAQTMVALCAVGDGAGVRAAYLAHFDPQTVLHLVALARLGLASKSGAAEALAASPLPAQEPAQEPVAWLARDENGGEALFLSKRKAELWANVGEAPGGWIEPLVRPSAPQPHAEGVEAAADLPWCDLKVAFDTDDCDRLWEVDAAGELALPEGWELNETDTAGARAWRYSASKSCPPSQTQKLLQTPSPPSPQGARLMETTKLTAPPMTIQHSSIVERLRALVIMDEVGSDNPLGREAADLIDTLAAQNAQLTARIEELTREKAALPFPGIDDGTEWSRQSYWDGTVGAFFDDGSWHPQVWGKHRALHFTAVRQALAIALQRAPECADVIASLVWQRELDRNREVFLTEQARARAALGKEAG